MERRVVCLGVAAILLSLTGVACERQPSPSPGSRIAQEGNYFESSWETATGKGDLAVMDGGRWDHRVTDGGINYIEVISELQTPAGVIHPVDGNNMLSVGANGPHYENVRVYDFIREHDEHTYLRFYMLVLKPSQPTGCLHGIQDLYCPDGEGSLNFFVYHHELGENGWHTGFAFRSEEDPATLDYFGNGHTLVGRDSYENLVVQWPYPPVSDPGLAYYRWYRFEAHVHWLTEKTSSSPTLYYLRVYDDTDRLVVDEHNLYSDQYDGSWQPALKSLSELYSLDDDFQGRRQYVAGTHRCLMFGTNGFGSADEPRLYLVDKVAFSAEDWIGE